MSCRSAAHDESSTEKAQQVYWVRLGLHTDCRVSGVTDIVLLSLTSHCVCGCVMTLFVPALAADWAKVKWLWGEGQIVDQIRKILKPAALL